MKHLTFLLTALALCMANVALADDVVIPTTDENPFDLTKGVITSEDAHDHFTSRGVEWMMGSPSDETGRKGYAASEE